MGRLSMLPRVSLPTANASRHLGSGEADYLLTFMTGADLGRRAHVDTNYTIGAIGDADGPHFAQHIVSASIGVSLHERWNPYFEGFGISRAEAGGDVITAIDTGVFYTIGWRIALDGGIQAGISHAAPAFAAFGGFSIALGHAHAPSTSTLGHASPRQLTSASAGQDRGSGPRR
jgi:hypothetical protein